jgi:hypothetical protein
LLDNIIHALIYSPSVKQWVRDYNFPGGTPTAAGDPVAFVQAYPTVNTVVYRTSNNHIEALYSTDGVNWLTHDLFEGTPAPDAAGDPAAYMTSYSDSAVLYRDFSGIIQELWLVPWGSSWQYAPLFRPGACPRAAGSPAGYVRSDGVNAVVYRGYDDSDIHELYFDGIWKCEDLSLRTGAPPALGDPAAYVRSDNVSSVVYRALKPTGQVHIQEIYGILPPPPPPRLPVAPLALNWGTADLSGMTGGLDAAGDPAPYILSFDGNSLAQANAVVYRDVSGNLQELYLSWGAANWVRYLLTPSGAPPANQ